MTNTRIARISDRAAVVETVVAAFIDDPAFRFFFETDDDYESKASVFVGYLFDKRIVHETVWVTDECEAVSLWSPPDHLLRDEHRERNRELHQAMQQTVGQNAARNLEIYDEEVAGGLPAQPYWYLGILAAHPTRAAKGAGRAVMQAGLNHVRSTDGMAILETTNARNPDYYQRNGWEVVNTIRSEAPSTIWILAAR